LIIDKNKSIKQVFSSSQIILKYKVENLIAQKLFDGSLQKNDKLVIKGEDII